jgi:hypothetical protein
MKTRELIKELRLKKGITQEELAAKTDISVIGDSFDLRLLKQNTKLSFSRDKVNTLDFSSFVGLRSQGARPRIPNKSCLNKSTTETDLILRKYTGHYECISDSSPFDLRKFPFFGEVVNTRDFSSFVGLRSQGARPRIPIFR